MLQVQRDSDGALRLSFGPSEAAPLLMLPGRLRKLLEDPDFTQRSLARLFPRAYEDPQKEAEYRRLLGDDLHRRKMESIEVFEGSLRDSRRSRKGLEVRISPEAFEFWLGFINDMRLVLAAELDIQDEGWTEDFDPDDSRAEDFALLHYLSFLEEILLGGFQ